MPNKVRVKVATENKVSQPLSLSPANIEWLFSKAAAEQIRLSTYVSASKIADDILTKMREAEAKQAKAVN